VQNSTQRLFPFDVNNRIHIFTELRALPLLKHPCTIGLIGFSFPAVTHPPTIIIERASHKTLQKCFSYTLSDTTIGEIVFGMQFIHSNAMTHGNLTALDIPIDAQ
jgi:hypothetical protein